MKSSERRKLKHDAYTDSVATAAAWAQKRQNTLVAAAVALAVVVAGVLWYLSTRRQAEQSAQELLQSARQEAAALTNLSESDQHAKAELLLRKFEQIAQEYAGTGAARAAMLDAGTLCARTGQTDKAVAFFRRALDATADLPGLAQLARRSLATTLEQAGKTEEALAQYQQLAANPPDAESIEALWDIGRCREKLGRNAEALDAYQKAVAFGGQSAWADLAAYRIAALSAPLPKKTPTIEAIPSGEPEIMLRPPVATTLPAATDNPDTGPKAAVPPPTEPE